MRRSMLVAIAGGTATLLLLAGCGTSSPSARAPQPGHSPSVADQLLALASDCKKVIGTSVPPAGDGGHHCMTPNDTRAQLPGAFVTKPAAAQDGQRLLNLCKLLAPRLSGISPFGQLQFAAADVIDVQGTDETVAECETARGAGLVGLLISHNAPVPTNVTPEKQADGSTLYRAGNQSPLCERMYPDAWTVVVVTGQSPPNVDVYCPAMTKSTHDWLSPAN